MGSMPNVDTGANKFLTPEIWRQFKNKKCDQGVTFNECIAAGTANDTDGIGVYSGSPNCYKVFAKFFDQVI